MFFEYNGKTYEGDEVILLNDIDFKGNEENEWVPIGIKEETPFKGTFNGDGHTIKDKIDVNYSLFDKVTGGTIKNLRLTGSYEFYEMGFSLKIYF